MVFRDHKKVSNEGPLSHVSRLFHKWWGSTKPNADMKNGLGTQAIDACELENRILYSGSPLPVDMMWVDTPVEVDAGMDVAVDCQPTEENPFEMQMDTFDISSLVDPVPATDAMLTAVVDAPSGIDELVFIDSGIENYQSMLADLHSQFGESANSEVIVLQSGDGVSQITKTLSQHRDLRAIHLVSHGSGDGLELGGMSLNTHNLSSYAGDIASWQAALTEDADILFYGCDLANDAAGSEFLEMISALTTADVAGSNDLTGHASLEGDWDLEFVTGELEADLVFSAEFRDTWVHTLIDRSTVSGESATSRGGAVDEPLLHANELWMSLQQTSTSGEPINGESVLQFGGAGLQLGDQGNDATISKLLSLGTGHDIDGLHYVTQDTQVTIGENTFSLEVGDVLLSTENDGFIDESLPGAGDALSFAADDIFLLKPTADGRYEANVTQLSMVLDFSTLNLSTAPTLGSFTLVENSFSLAGYELAAGEILFAEASSAQNNDVHVLHSADRDHETASSRLIDGQAIGWPTAIHGLDVIEQTITVGGQLLMQGTLVLAAPTSDTGTPMDMGAWSCADVVAFDISQTEMTGGTQSEDQLVLLDSSKMGFPCEQGFFSLTIIGEEVDTGPTEYFTGGEFNIAADNRNTKIELHGLFDFAGTGASHPDPTYTVTDVSDPELFRVVRITPDDMIQMNAKWDRLGSSTIVVRATGSDGTYSEAEFTVNVNTSSEGEMKSGMRGGDALSQLRVLDRSANVYEGLDSGVTIIQLETCSDLSINVISGETSLELEPEPEKIASSAVEEPQETVGDEGKLNEMTGETGTISAVVVNAQTPSMVSGSELTLEGVALAGTSDVFEIDFKSRTSARFQASESASSYFVYQVQTLTSTLVNLQDNPLTFVTESANPFAFTSLNDYSEGIDEAVDHYGVALAGSLISLSGISIGVVGWMARNSALVTSLMASMPTWQLIDPLVVLGNVDDLDPGESVMDIIAAGGTVDASCSRVA